jgi:carbonic anhydrase
MNEQKNITGLEALRRLREGNGRYVAHAPSMESRIDAVRRAELAAAQRPFAIVLGCSDSRVPIEIVFDQGPGDLFVIRVAGNIVAPSQVGSVEYAAWLFDTRLVVVLGHSECGAIQVTLEQLRRPTAIRSPNLKSIVDRIRPGIKDLLRGKQSDNEADIVPHAVRANIRWSVQQLRHGSAIIEELIASQGMLVIGAEYSLETGVVEFLDDT